MRTMLRVATDFPTLGQTASEIELFGRDLEALVERVQALPTLYTSASKEKRAWEAWKSVTARAKAYTKGKTTGKWYSIWFALNSELARWEHDRGMILKGVGQTSSMSAVKRHLLENLATVAALFGAVAEAEPEPTAPVPPPEYVAPPPTPAPGIDMKTVGIVALAAAALMFGPKLLKGLK